MQKLYCYVDETGQDTKGNLFIVSIILTETNREKLEKGIEEIEKKSNKGKLKWSRAKPERRVAYMTMVCKEFTGERILRFSVYRDTKDYDLATMTAISKAIHFNNWTLANSIYGGFWLHFHLKNHHMRGWLC